MSAQTPMEGGIFALATIAMVLFLFVWCLRRLVRFHRNERSLDGTRHGASELMCNKRGLELLKQWLSPEQLRCYETYGFFEVIGSEGGRIYRIHHGVQANIEQLDSAGHPVCAWCFVPEGSLVAGDVMLAQKIALETDERAALAVAVRYAALHHRNVTRRSLSVASW